MLPLICYHLITKIPAKDQVPAQAGAYWPGRARRRAEYQPVNGAEVGGGRQAAQWSVLETAQRAPRKTWDLPFRRALEPSEINELNTGFRLVASVSRFPNLIEGRGSKPCRRMNQMGAPFFAKTPGRMALVMRDNVKVGGVRLATYGSKRHQQGDYRASQSRPSPSCCRRKWWETGLRRCLAASSRSKPAGARVRRATNRGGQIVSSCLKNRRQLLVFGRISG